MEAQRKWWLADFCCNRGQIRWRQKSSAVTAVYHRPLVPIALFVHCFRYLWPWIRVLISSFKNSSHSGCHYRRWSVRTYVQRISLTAAADCSSWRWRRGRDEWPRARPGVLFSATTHVVVARLIGADSVISEAGPDRQHHSALCQHRPVYAWFPRRCRQL